jgi:hypothetical protein
MIANYYSINERPPQHEHRPYEINGHAGVAVDFPLQAEAATPAPVCTTLPFHIHVSNETFSRRKLSWSTTQLDAL